MKLVSNNGNTNIKVNNNISQKEWQNKLKSKIKEIDSMINNSNLEDKQKTLEIQKNNAYFKLEKIGKELQDIEDFLEEENEKEDINNIEDEENLKKKIYDIRQKNITIQGQINILKGYNNFVNKYKAKQISEMKDLDYECDKIKGEIQMNKCYTKITEEEKIIFEKRKQLESINKQIENLLKKIEEKKAQKYITNLRLKQLKYLSNENKNSKKNLKETKNNKINPKKNQVKKKINNNINKNNNNGDMEIFDDIIQNPNINKNNENPNKKEKVESTFDIINRRIPFTISSLDNLINDQNISPIKINQTNNTKKKAVSNNKKKVSDLIKAEKENINKIISSSENKNNINSNNNYNKNNNSNFNSNKNELKNENNKLVNSKEENNKKEIYDNSNPLGWLENDKKEHKVDVYYNFSNDTKNNKEEYKFVNNENDESELNANNNINNNNNNININTNANNNINTNINNNINSNVNNNINNADTSEIKGLFGNRRRPFASIKF